MYNKLPVGMSNQRLDAFPLDASSEHDTLADAVNYALNNPNSLMILPTGARQKSYRSWYCIRI